jgi:hypothetical protein
METLRRCQKGFAAFAGVIFLSGVLIFLTGFILTSKVAASIMLMFAGP